jgi:predicted transcriptional regulator
MVKAVRELDSWLCETGRKRGWVAEQLGVSRGMISRYFRGVLPTRQRRAQLEKLSDGRIKATYWTAEQAA